jgi:hypothetical protein
MVSGAWLAGVDVAACGAREESAVVTAAGSAPEGVALSVAA